MNVPIRHVKFYTCYTNIKGDILIKKKQPNFIWFILPNSISLWLFNDINLGVLHS